MKSIFSPHALEHLSNFLDRDTLLAFDFDGTLTKIVKTPSEVRLDAKIRAKIHDLAHTAPVAIVSGRSQKDLKRFFKGRKVNLVGNHGGEGHPKAKAAVRSWRKILKSEAWPLGVEIEEKTYSISIHFRRVRVSEKVIKSHIEKIAQNLMPKVRLVHGKKVINLVVPEAPHKGDAVLSLAKRLKIKKIFFIGDDVTDEDVFRVQDKRVQIFSVKVGSLPKSRAQYLLSRQNQMGRLLSLLQASID